MNDISNCGHWFTSKLLKLPALIYSIDLYYYAMPRLSRSLLRRAYKISPHLAAILPACRDIPSATQELQWIKQHVENTPSKIPISARLSYLCHKRGKGTPLQYILGSQPFGDLDIKCKPGVLIPRPETEAYTTYLSKLLLDGLLLPDSLARGQLSILDLCSGTGCIPLHLYSSLQATFPTLNVRGVDISSRALNLGQENLQRGLQNGTISPHSNGQSMEFVYGNIFDQDFATMTCQKHWDILLSNPPYVSKAVWHAGRAQLGYSVRKYEPKLALVPPDDIPLSHSTAHEDAFYDRLLDLHQKFQPKLALFEIGDDEQAHRVLRMAVDRLVGQQVQMQIWNDWPESINDKPKTKIKMLDPQGYERDINVLGSGNPRAVVIRPLDVENARWNGGV